MIITTLGVPYNYNAGPTVTEQVEQDSRWISGFVLILLPLSHILPYNKLG
jgi:hypothetical protein